jgi:hypothetical protein
LRPFDSLPMDAMLSPVFHLFPRTNCNADTV